MKPFYRNKFLIIKRANNEILAEFVKPEHNQLIIKLFADSINAQAIIFNPKTNNLKSESNLEIIDNLASIFITETNNLKADITIDMLVKLISIIEIYNDLGINIEADIQALDSFNSGADFQILFGGLENIDVVASDSILLEPINYNLNIGGLENIDVVVNDVILLVLDDNLSISGLENTTMYANDSFIVSVNTNKLKTDTNVKAINNPIIIFDSEINNIKTDINIEMNTMITDYINITETVVHDIKADLVNNISSRTSVNNVINFNITNDVNIQLLKITLLFNLYPFLLSEKYEYTLKDMYRFL